MPNNPDFLGIDPRLGELGRILDRELAAEYARADAIAEQNHMKVLGAFHKNRLSESHLGYATGYGYGDPGRDVLEEIYADIFKTEAALVRPQIVSGTHALSLALSGNLKHGDELLSAAGSPYDTLQSVIGTRDTPGSLIRNGVLYKQAELKDGKPDIRAILAAISDKTRLVTIQRSRGYSLRDSLSIDQCREIINAVKSLREDIICMVDNCYCEFVSTEEPCESGADMAVGSLIKNMGGGIAPVGGYIAGKLECVENASYRLTAPGLGRELGPSLGIASQMMQGLFLAPTVVAAAVKNAVFAAALFERLGFPVEPKPQAQRSDIVQAIVFGKPEPLLSFCAGIQKAAPVDSFVRPEAWDMPGYGDKVVMAAGAFVAGSSIELSADAPMREPFAAYLQGGLTREHGKTGILIAANEMLRAGFINLTNLTNL